MSVNKILVNNSDSNYTHSIFDISEYTGNSYSTLSDAINDIPQAKQKGGMTIRYIDSNDKYVQYKYTGTEVTDESFLNTDNWQKNVDQSEVLEIEKAIGANVKTLIDKGTTLSYIPTSDGSIVSGGSSYASKEYDVERLNKLIDINSKDWPNPSPTQFISAVLYALYSTDTPGTSGLLVVGSLLSSGETEGKIDLSQYPTAKLLKVTVYKPTPNYSVKYLGTSLAEQTEVDALSNDVAHIQANAVFKSDIIDDLESDASNKTLSAKQGKVLDRKIENIAYDTKTITLTPTNVGGSNIPKADGGMMSGGGSWRRNDYNVAGIDKAITITTDAHPVTNVSLFVGCIYYILKDSSSNVLYAGTDLHEINPSPITLDLSSYQGASVLQITVNGTTKASSVTYENKVPKFVRAGDIVDNLTSSDADKPLSAKLGKVLNDKIDNYAPSVLLAMPPIIELVGKKSDDSIYGNRLQIYYRDIVGAVEPFKFQMKPICAGGQIKHRYFCYDAKSVTTENIPFKLQIQSDSGSVVTEKNTIIKVIAPPTSPASNKNILLLGSSTLGTGTVAKELHRRLCETSGNNNTYRYNPKGLGLTNISFVGRRYGSVYNEVLQESIGGAGFSKKYAIDSGNQIRFFVASGNIEVGDVYSDGVTNYTVTEDNVATVSGGNFLTAQATEPVSASGTLTKVSGGGDATIAYTSYYKESGNPFWDRTLSTPGLNFQKYADEYCNGTIDIIVSLMTGNDLSELSGNIDSLLANYVKPFVRKYHQEFPNGKFIFGIQPPYSIYGGSALTYDMKLWTINYALALYDMAADNEFSSYFSIAHTLQLFDNDYMFPLSSQSVANRLPNIVEKETNNGTHPTGAGGQFQIGDDEAGCLTLADGLYYAICAVL